MKAKTTIQKPSCVGGVSKFGTFKGFLFVLILLAAVGTLGLLSLFQNVQLKSPLFNSNPFVSSPHFLNHLTQDKYILLEDGDSTSDNLTNNSKKFHNHFLVVNPKLLTSLNPDWEIFFGSINSSLYFSFFASLPSRSPPLPS